MGAKYGETDGWDPIVPRGPFGWSPWRSILSQLDRYKAGLAFKVGDGRRIRFWKDAWCGERPLMEVYPEIFSMAVDPNIVVASYMSILGGEIVWQPCLRRAAFDWEIDSKGGPTFG